MQPTAIAIYGPANQGKSATIKAVAHQLQLMFPSLIKQVINDGVDITYIFEVNNIKIGIESQGDPNSHQAASLRKFVTHKCEIIICASRTTGMTVDAVNDLHNQHGYHIIWSANHRSWEKNQTQLNEISAKQICELIHMILKGQL